MPQIILWVIPYQSVFYTSLKTPPAYSPPLLLPTSSYYPYQKILPKNFVTTYSKNMPQIILWVIPYQSVFYTDRYPPPTVKIYRSVSIFSVITIGIIYSKVLKLFLCFQGVYSVDIKTIKTYKGH